MNDDDTQVLDAEDELELQLALLQSGMTEEEHEDELPEVDTAGGISFDDEFDLDKQIEMLMEADQEADEEFSLENVGRTIKLNTVYDDGLPGALRYSKQDALALREASAKKPTSDVSVSKFIFVAVISAALIVGGFFVVRWAMDSVTAQQALISQVSHFTPVSLPTNVANNANFLFTDKRITLGEQTFSLVRIASGYTGTFFYFRESIYTDNFIILLYNQNRTLYPRHLYEMYNETSNILRFEPITADTLFLTLFIQCRSTNEYASFNFRFETPPVLPQSIHINFPIRIIGDDPHGLTVTHATFGSTASVIHYTFPADPTQSGLRRRLDGEGPSIILRDVFSIMQPKNKYPLGALFSEHNIYMGSAVFAPVLNLSGNINLEFANLYYLYFAPEFDVRPIDLFGNNQLNPFTVDTGRFRINLEGMAQQGNYLILTVHGLNESGERVRTRPNMSLQINLPTTTITIPAITRVSPIGTDVLFDLTDYIPQIRGFSISYYDLLIHYIEYDVDDLTIPINLNRARPLPSHRRDAAEWNIREAFNALLSLRSSELTRTGLISISPSLVLDAGFMQDFEPRLTETRPMYGARVITGDFVDNYTYIALVELQWVAGVGENIEYFSAIYEVTALSQEGIWQLNRAVRR